ncbi:MAG: hypothetical protein E6Q93_27980 [Burkholderiaceae bacterium]|nr:MAG: hypothetical protein E6Q93_27980 [Burkholderiaceae bacterium]
MAVDPGVLVLRLRLVDSGGASLQRRRRHDGRWPSPATSRRWRCASARRATTPAAANRGCACKPFCSRWPSRPAPSPRCAPGSLRCGRRSRRCTPRSSPSARLRSWRPSRPRRHRSRR